LPVAVRAALLMVIGCILFSITGGLVKLLGQRLDSLQIAFFRSVSVFSRSCLSCFTRKDITRSGRPILMAISRAARSES
jgi:hypothetical protein